MHTLTVTHAHTHRRARDATVIRNGFRVPMQLLPPIIGQQCERGFDKTHEPNVQLYLLRISKLLQRSFLFKRHFRFKAKIELREGIACRSINTEFPPTS